MKKINIFLILFSLIFISCSDDDSSGTNNDVGITGKWEITEIKFVASFVDSNGNEQEQELTSTTENCDPTPTWDFMSNGNFEATEFDVDPTDSSCNVYDVMSGATWEETGNNTIKINEESTSEEIILEINYTGNNQAEATFDEPESESEIVATFFLSRL